MKEFVKNIFKTIAYIGIGVFTGNVIQDNRRPIIIIKGTYDGAIKAINDSDMWSSDKLETISVIKRDETSEYYNAIISIADSDMWSKDKLEAVRNINKGVN